MNILYLAVGSATLIHTQAMFALRTAYINKGQSDNIHIMTDSPALYRNLSFVNVVPITEEEIKEWKGKDGYFFRVKICAVRKFVSLYHDTHLLYLDCDTYIQDSLSSIAKCLDDGRGVMHKDEGSMAKMPGASGEMWQQTKGKDFAGITIEEKYHMWNSGAYGIPQAFLDDVMQKSVDICDEFLNAGVTSFNLEQWAGAISLLHFTGRIEPAEKAVGHYWHHKETWLRFISLFFLKSAQKGWTIEEEVARIKVMNFQGLKKRLAVIRAIRKLYS